MKSRNNLTVERKVDLLNYLITTSRTWTEPDLATFFAHVQETFPGLKDTKWVEKGLETKMRIEERHWLAESAGSRARRRGHEKDSRYDQAMSTWKEIWNDMLVKDWQKEVDYGLTYDQVPASLRNKVVFPTRPSSRPSASTSTPNASKASSASSASSAPPLAPPLAPPSAPHKTVEETNNPQGTELEYDDEKLKSIIDSAVENALSRGEADTAAAVLVVYQDSQEIWELRYLLEQIFKQTANDEQTSRFHEYIRAAKRKVRLRKAQQKQDALRQSGNSRASMANSDSSVAAQPSFQAPPPVVQQKLEPLSPADAGPSQWPAAVINVGDADMADAPHADTPDAQLAAEEQIAEQQATRTSQTKGGSVTAVPSDSGYETTEKQLHRDPLVTKILGDLQHEPSVEKLLRFDRALPTSANVKQLRKRESALEAIKEIVTDHPAAKTDLTVLAQKLQERNAREAEADGEQATADAEDGEEAHEGHEGHEGQEEEEEEEEDADATPRTRRSLRPRRSTGCESNDRIQSERRRGYTGHGIRHANIHSGVRDYDCPSCHKLFSRKDNMMEHFRGVHKNRVSSKKRGRQSSILSDTKVAEEADRIAAERAGKRQKSVEKSTARNARAVRDSSVDSAESLGSTDSSLTDLSSAAEDRYAPAAGSCGNRGMTKPTQALEDSVNKSHENLNPTVKAIAAQMARDPATLVARLETKMDALLARNTAPAPSSSTSTPHGTYAQPDAEHAIWSSAMSLLNIAASFNHDGMETQSSELVQFVARLTKTAAEAVIRASDSAKRLALTAMSISEMMEDHDGSDEQMDFLPSDRDH
ncbi:hypothetical protein CERZMDRAFT_80569 [Cercospora zeae-maydis SCOH1-5]|uniref:C2H2-type domain-containing protein n=1 Tax=Cercospora zeae-maydis SCOH1-5 TaxID=717836 RepID=A0A6A6FXH9_9PEZI|nr:hypothetical protein CERZMDRAFT_80569 [Cercospora zeae-maydis SCOH1-5]